ncbi:2718_t:CDS:2, partial [Gigaspora rosea]
RYYDQKCWSFTGILSDITNSDKLEPEQFMDTDKDDYDTIDLTDDRDLELYYKLVDEPSTTDDAMNDKEILAMVHRTFDPKPAATDSEEDEAPPAPPVNLSEAINALQLLIQFQEQRESDDGFKPEELNILRKKMYHFEKLKNSAKKQTDLFHYFDDTENLFE